MGQFIPSPAQGVWNLGPFPLRAYALCIITGIIVAIYVAEKRWIRRGGTPGAYLAARRRRMSFREVLDVVAPAVAVAQGIGRWGNWFNQELFGTPTTLPWGLRIDGSWTSSVDLGAHAAHELHPLAPASS